MPIYDYHCDHCGHVFSAVQSFKDEALAACPSCGKRPRRLLSKPALVFKGSGWYKTDSRGPAPSESSSSKDTSSKDTSSKDTSSKDTSSKDTSGGTESSDKKTPAKSGEKSSSPDGG